MIFHLYNNPHRSLTSLDQLWDLSVTCIPQWSTFYSLHHFYFIFYYLISLLFYTPMFSKTFLMLGTFLMWGTFFNVRNLWGNLKTLVGKHSSKVVLRDLSMYTVTIWKLDKSGIQMVQRCPIVKWGSENHTKKSVLWSKMSGDLKNRTKKVSEKSNVRISGVRDSDGYSNVTEVSVVT